MAQVDQFLVTFPCYIPIDRNGGFPMASRAKTGEFGIHCFTDADLLRRFLNAGKKVNELDGVEMPLSGEGLAQYLKEIRPQMAKEITHLFVDYFEGSPRAYSFRISEVISQFDPPEESKSDG